VTPVIHLVLDGEAHRMKEKARMSDAWAVTRCCKKPVLDLYYAGDHFTAHPSIANCPQSHSTVSGKEPE